MTKRKTPVVMSASSDVHSMGWHEAMGVHPEEADAATIKRAFYALKEMARHYEQQFEREQKRLRRCRMALDHVIMVDERDRQEIPF